MPNIKRRSMRIATQGDSELGPLNLLPGTWKNVDEESPRGWNMIALPFINPNPTDDNPNLEHRLLVNRFHEELIFSLEVDDDVPNRGIDVDIEPPENTDQHLAAVAYEQKITQVAADDFPRSGLAGGQDLPIHHEPGLWLHIKDRTTQNQEMEELNIARLATIPHGNSVLALGHGSEDVGIPDIPDISGLPIGVKENPNPNPDLDLDEPYFLAYKHFHENLFQGEFDPVHPNKLLENSVPPCVEIQEVTRLQVSTKQELPGDQIAGGIVNIPFIMRQANATEMESTFWIYKCSDGVLRMQYTQTVFLEFIERVDGQPGLIRWPHVTINTLEKQ